jgi:LAS superfamily LD-carboxypeptidase LdcB
MTLPFIKLVVPTALKQYKNGQLAESVLAPVKTGGKMYAPVAAEFNKMYDAALAAGFKLKNVGDYRSFDGQLSMFMDRYVTTDTGTGVTRQYEGKTWYLKKGKAPSAAPDPTGLKGSNHGWGLAIDLGYDVNGKLTSMVGACFDWMCANAPKYGFYLQGNNQASKEFEAWHWQYCLGDKPRSVAPAPTA